MVFAAGALEGALAAADFAGGAFAGAVACALAGGVAPEAGAAVCCARTYKICIENTTNITMTVINRFRIPAFSHPTGNSANHPTRGMALEVNGTIFGVFPPAHV